MPVYRIFISHRYERSEEYQRLVRMLDRAEERDRKWRWVNYSIPKDQSILTESEARQAEVFEERLRARISQVHAVLYILRDDWLAEMGSLWHELNEATRLRYGIDVPIISVLPRGNDPRSLQYRSPGVATVRWRASSIVRAIREHALPVSIDELRLTPRERAERARISELLGVNDGRMAKTARALGMSKDQLARKIVAYVIR